MTDPLLSVSQETSKRNKKGERIIKEGYIDKPKGMKHIAWERGLYKPESEGKMHGKKIDPDDEKADPSLSTHCRTSCPTVGTSHMRRQHSLAWSSHVGIS